MILLLQLSKIFTSTLLLILFCLTNFSYGEPKDIWKKSKEINIQKNEDKKIKEDNNLNKDLPATGITGVANKGHPSRFNIGRIQWIDPKRGHCHWRRDECQCIAEHRRIDRVLAEAAVEVLAQHDSRNSCSNGEPPRGGLRQRKSDQYPGQDDRPIRQTRLNAAMS